MVRRTAPLWLLACACAGSARAEAPACRAQVSLEPARAVVGQQVRHRVRIERRDDVRQLDWLEPPAAANARLELLPPDPRPPLTRDGVGYEVYDELRALFPERAGRLRLPEASLRCERSEGAQEIRVPGAVLEVEAPPAAGRPAGYAGLVGPLLLNLTVTPEQVTLGESLRVALMARGVGNLWLLEAPFPADAFGDAEVFPRPPELAFERGRDLFVRQHLAFDLVPRHVGPLRIPPLAVTFWDPERGAYREATTQEVMVAVVEPEAVSEGMEAPPRGARPARAQTSSRLVLLAVAAAGLAIGGAAAWWQRRRRSAEDLPLRELERAARAHAASDLAGELAGFARALRAALSRQVPGAAALSVEELLERDLSGAARAAALLLSAVERARYDRAARAPDAKQVEQAVRALVPAAGGRAFVFSWLLLALVAGGVETGCASSGAAPGDPMTPARLEALLRDEVESVEEVDEQLRLVHDGVRMICLWDVRSDRMRLMAAVTEESELTIASARILLQANFGQTLDARYAIKDGTLYAVYLHPLSTLEVREVKWALEEVANLVRNYGTTYSAINYR